MVVAALVAALLVVQLANAVAVECGSLRLLALHQHQALLERRSIPCSQIEQRYDPMRGCWA